MAAACLALACVAGPACADVLEIQSDGSVVRYTGPMQIQNGKVQSLTPPTRIAGPNAAVVAGPARTAPAAVSEAIKLSAARHGVDADLIEAVAWQESRFNQTAVSPKGAKGVMQLMPGTARGLGADRDDLASNIDGGAAYLARMLRMFDGDVARALAAYNAGPGAVQKFGGIPPYAETRAYVNSILGRLARRGVTAFGTSQ